MLYSIILPFPFLEILHYKKIQCARNIIDTPKKRFECYFRYNGGICYYCYYELGLVRVFPNILNIFKSYYSVLFFSISLGKTLTNPNSYYYISILHLLFYLFHSLKFYTTRNYKARGI